MRNQGSFMKADDDSSEIDRIGMIFQRLGAPEGQARIMARQLFRRAEQLAEEQGRPVPETLAPLLEKAVQGRMGISESDEQGN